MNAGRAAKAADQQAAHDNLRKTGRNFLARFSFFVR
jgi:hypothetical protein